MSMKGVLLTLAIGLTAGFGLGFAVPVLAGVETAAKSKTFWYSYEVVRVPNYIITKVTDRRLGKVCYITTPEFGRETTMSCVQI